MRPIQRDGLLLMLAVGSGSADGWSFFGLGHAFVANMTGNTVLLGISVFHQRTDLLHPLVALGCYVAGTALGTWLSRDVRRGEIWSRSVSWTLLLESLLLLIAEGGWAAVHAHPGYWMELFMLGWVALAVGLQSGAMVRLQIPGVVTTYITGTWTTLTGGLTLFAARRPRSARDRTRLEERFELQAGVLGFYILAAVAAGWAFRYEPVLVGALPTAAVLLVAAFGTLWN